MPVVWTGIRTGVPVVVSERNNPARQSAGGWQRLQAALLPRAAGIAMAFKLIESAQRRWRAVNAPHLVALVRAGATFERGKLVERPEESGRQQNVA